MLENLDIFKWILLSSIGVILAYAIIRFFVFGIVSAIWEAKYHVFSKLTKQGKIKLEDKKEE